MQNYVQLFRMMYNRGMTESNGEPARGALNILIAEHMRRYELKDAGQFAEKAGLSRSTVYGVIRGQVGPDTYPSLVTLIRLAEVLDRPTHELLYLLAPDAPGSPTRPTDTRREEARARLRALSASLPDSESFLAQRLGEFGESN